MLGQHFYPKKTTFPPALNPDLFFECYKSEFLKETSFECSSLYARCLSAVNILCNDIVTGLSVESLPSKEKRTRNCWEKYDEYFNFKSFQTDKLNNKVIFPDFLYISVDNFP